MKPQQKINCKQANEISILKIALHEGLTPTKVQGDNAWIKLRNERTASCKIDTVKNIFYDFGTGEGGTTIDFIIILKNTDIKGALEYLSPFVTDDFSFDQQNQKIDSLFEELGHKNNTDANFEKTTTYTIDRIEKLKNNALLQYLNKRCIDLLVAKNFVKEVYFTINDKKLFGICLENDLGGVEIRNSFYKGCLGKKSYTLVKRERDSQEPHRLLIFEGMMDYLSYLTSHNSLHYEDYLILHSVAMMNKTDHLIPKYDGGIVCYFDHDEAGKNAFKTLQNKFTHIHNGNTFYSGFKDINEWLCARGNLL